MIYGHTIKKWLIASRPWSFPASSVPVLATLAFLVWDASRLNEIDCDWTNGALAVLGMVLLQGAANLISDYFDFKTGVDRIDTFGSDSITSGRFRPVEILVYGIVWLIAGCSVGVFLAWQTDVRLLGIGVVGVFFAIFYPYFKYRALGDAVIFVVFSVLPILGTSLVVCGEFRWETLVLAVPIGLITVAILHANNWRDIESDQRARVHTFGMILGSTVSQWVYVFEALLPFLWIVGAIAAGTLLPVWSVLSLLALPLALRNVQQAIRSQDNAAAISNLDENTAKLQLCFGVALSFSFLLAAFI